MARNRRGGELEVLAPDGEGAEAASACGPPAPPGLHLGHRPGPRPGTSRRRPAIRRGAVALGTVIAVEVAAAVGIAVHRKQPLVPPGPSPAAVNHRLVLSRAQVVTVLGDKLVARTITSESGGERLLGLVDPGPDGALEVDSATVLVQGAGFRDPATIGSTGTWAFPADGSGAPRYLGPSSSFRSFSDVWLVSPTETWWVDVHSGSTLEGPYALIGRPVAAVGAGLVLQRGDQVWWWIPGPPGSSRLIGRGVALDGEGEYILWEGTDGRLTITDPHTMQAWRTAVTAGQSVGRAVLSPSRYRVAVVDGHTLRIGDGILGHRVVKVHLGQVNGLAWLDDTTLMASVGPRGLVAIDAASGHVVHEPDFSADSHGLAIVPAAVS